MKRFFILLLLPVLGAKANDGVFYASGNTLVPLKETTIRLKKEILNLTRKEGWMQVDIYFEFFNPGPDKELTVGFVTPPASGDVTDEEAKHPFVRDFMVMSGENILPYKVAMLTETGFKVSSKISDGNDFVYYFTIKFVKGITAIRHSYTYKGGGSVEAKEDFDYRLTTGTTWANSGIDDFELNIDMGDDSYYSVPAMFGTAAAPWQLAGIGRVSKTNFALPFLAEGKARLKMVYIRKGKLQLRTANFKPTEDLSITFWHLHNEWNLWCDKSVKNDFSDISQFIWGEAPDVIISKMTNEQLRLYRNLNYARMGYDFKDADLKKAFSKYIWYLPDPALKPDAAPVNYYIASGIMEMIIKEENKRKGK